MRIVIILCLWPPPRKVLAPETSVYGPSPSYCSTTQNPLSPPTPFMWICPDCGKLAWTRALMTPRSRENHRPQGNTPPPNFACNSPPLNFARNSLTTFSNFEFISLEFCGFLTIAHLSDHRITCEIGDELRKPTAARPHALRRSRNYVLTLPRLPSP